MRTIIISQPKAGTYLCANLLVEFGLTHLPMHLNKWRYEYYIGKELYRRVNSPFTEAVKKVRDNQFVVTHVSAVPEHQEAIQDFKKIIVTRDLQERLESWARWTTEPNKKLLSHEKEWNAHNGKRHWARQKGCFVIDFKDFKEYNIEKIDQMQRYLFGRIHYDSKACLTAAMEKDSLTKFTKK